MTFFVFFLSVEKQQDICHQYLRGRCYRGSACRFAHVLPGKALSYVFPTKDLTQHSTTSLTLFIYSVYR